MKNHSEYVRHSENEDTEPFQLIYRNVPAVTLNGIYSEMFCRYSMAIVNSHCKMERERQDGKWDLIIAHPPCTYLCMSSQKHCNVEVFGEKAVERQKKREDAIKFFMRFANADCDRIAIENPVGIMSSRYKKATQYIQPFQFGHPTSKKTGLWLKGLPKLKPTKIVDQEFHTSGTGRKWDKWFWDSSCIANREERSKFRSKTFEGIAKAMAEQWG